MTMSPKRDPEQEAIGNRSNQLSGDGAKPVRLFRVDVIPVGMKGVDFLFLASAYPGIQNASPPLRIFYTDVEERLADVEDALQPNAECADLVDIVLLGPTDGLVKRLTILVRKRAVIRHEKCWAAKQTVSSIRPTALQYRKCEMARPRIVGILNKLPKQRTSVPGILVHVSQESLDSLDLVEWASDDTGVGADIDVRQALLLGSIVHQNRTIAFVGDGGWIPEESTCQMLVENVGIERNP